MPVITAVDLLGIQDYVFASNRLKDAIGASWLVDWATRRDGESALQGLVSSDNLLLAAGGNALLRFEEVTVAQRFAADYSRRLHNQAPGLEAAIAHQPYNEGGLAAAVLEVQEKLGVAKLARRPSVPLLGLGVTAACRETGLPAAGISLEGQSRVPVSARMICAREMEKEKARDQWDPFLAPAPSPVTGKITEFPLEFDRLGRSHGDSSLIGIVHVDGNGIGDKILSWLVECARLQQAGQLSDDDFVQEYQRWSEALKQRGCEMLHAVMRRVGASLESGEAGSVRLEGTVNELGFPLKEVKESFIQLPVRPVLLGGDDFTFVCDGRLALELAEIAMTAFEAPGELKPLGALHACAGVAIVGVHTPFRRSYDLAEQLCGSAKRLLRAKQRDGCALDWHIGITRPGETVAGVRARQYEHGSDLLTCRPYPVQGAGDLSWQWLSENLLGTGPRGLRGEAWSGSRNKIKAFRELLRDGRDAVGRSLQAWQVVDRRLDLPVRLDRGFDGPRTPLLDAVELLDLHLPLKEERCPDA